MSFRHAMAVITATASIAVFGASLAFAADPPTQPAASAQAAPTTQPEGSSKPAQTEVAVAAPAPTEPPHAGDATAGQAKAAVCGACHGIDGNSAQSLYPKLAGQQEEYIAREIILFKSHARDSAIMMGFAMSLTPQDAHDIGAYFASKKSLPGVADSALVARGQALYRGGDKSLNVPACMACHGPDGRGNPGSGYPQLAGQWSDYISAKLKDFHAQKTWGDDDRAKIMPMIAKNLSDSDIAALASYVEGLHAADADSTAAK
ncbi:MAG: c-type cytochrome [Rudaea sp.]